MMVPRRGDAFAESVPSPQPAGAGASQAAGLDDTRMDITQLNSRGGDLCEHTMG